MCMQTKMGMSIGNPITVGRTLMRARPSKLRLSKDHRTPEALVRLTGMPSLASEARSDRKRIREVDLVGDLVVVVEAGEGR